MQIGLEGDILRNAALFSSVDDRYADKTDLGRLSANGRLFYAAHAAKRSKGEKLALAAGARSHIRA